MADIRDLKFRRDNLEIDLELAEAKLETARLRAQANRPGAAEEVVAATAEINRIKAELAAVNQQINQLAPTQSPRTSAGEVVVESQAARDDNAYGQNPPEGATVLAVPDRIVDVANTESGTNDLLRPLTFTQGTPPVSQAVLDAQRSSNTDVASPYAQQTAGVGARNDDSSAPTTGGAQSVINAAFSTPGNAKIISQPNTLNQFASYTYAITWYLLTPAQYNTMQTTGRKDCSTWQILMQSGGAPTQAQPNSASRNQYFDLDYYIDDLEIDSLVPLKGTNMAHSATDLRFKVVEPNGLTLIQNLYRAVDSLYKSPTATSGGKTTTTATPNYPMAQYCLAIRFYGYDANGNLSQIKGQRSGSDTFAAIEKFYPFVITNIRFRMANRAVEYEVQGKPMGQFYNLSQDRGTIPFNFSLIGETVGDVLVGKPVGTKYPTEDGRQDAPAPKSASLSPAPLTQTPNLVTGGTAQYDELGNYIGTI